MAKLDLVIAHHHVAHQALVVVMHVARVKVKPVGILALKKLLSGILLGGKTHAQVVLVAVAVAQKHPARVAQKIVGGVGIAPIAEAVGLLKGVLVAHDKVVRAVVEQFAQAELLQLAGWGHRHKGLDVADGAHIKPFYGLQFVNAVELAILGNVAQQVQDLNVAEHKQIAQLLFGGAVEVERAIEVVAEAVKEGGVVEFHVFIQELGDGLDALFDDEGGFVVLRPEECGAEQYQDQQAFNAPAHSSG